MQLAPSRNFTADWSPKKVDRVDLVQHVADEVKARILDKTMPARSSLPGENALAQKFGVSRTVVREALRVLSARGLVELSHGRPAAVKDPDHQASVEALGVLFKRSNATPMDLIEVRRVLEGEIAALAAVRASSKDIETMEQACHALERATNPEEIAQADVAFHLCLAEATRNPCFIQMIQTLRAVFLESIRETRQRCARNVHEPILAAVKARDPERARQRMLEHILKTKSLLTQPPPAGENPFGKHTEHQNA
jgi:DNA-binding FadR family transcriptional regulator